MKRYFLLTALLIVAATILNAQTGRDIAQRVKDRPDGDTRYAEMQLTLIKKNGDQRERKMVSWAMDDDKWLYLPAMKKTRRISGASSKTDYFMGTDFTYDDMGGRNVDEDTHTLLREEMRDGHQCWVVESVPVDTREIYSRKVSWIRQDCDAAVYVEFYDKLNKLHRVMTVLDLQQVEGFWTIMKMEMRNVQNGHSTQIVVSNPRYNIEVDKNMFTVTKLEKGL